MKYLWMLVGSETGGRWKEKCRLEGEGPRPVYAALIFEIEGKGL